MRARDQGSSVHHILAGLRWQAHKQSLAREGQRTQHLLQTLGVAVQISGGSSAEAEVIPVEQAASRRLSRFPGDDSLRGRRVAASVCTLSHVHLARTMAASLRRHHPEMHLFVLLIDGLESDRPEIAEGTIVLPSDLGAPMGYDLLKWTAMEACAASKALLVDELIARGAESVVFLDSDLLVYSPMEQLLTPLESHDLVVVPHMREPFAAHPWEHPGNADVTRAGVLNSGLFGVRGTAVGRRFMQQWAGLLQAPGAFLDGGHANYEQTSFSWCLSFVEAVHIVRSPAVNVAYWNLHERSLRATGREAGCRRWEVDGQQLETFHWSGFEAAPAGRISKWDGRHPTWSHGDLSLLADEYRQQLQQNGASLSAQRPYRFDSFPSGIAIDDRMRRLFKQHELFWGHEEDPWSAEGERRYCEALLKPSAGAPSLLAALVHDVWAERPDLQLAFPHALLRPRQMLEWFASSGAAELGYERLFDLHRPVVLTIRGAQEWQRIRKTLPRIFEGLEAPLRGDRSVLKQRLASAGLQDFVQHVGGLTDEIWALSPVFAIRSLYEQREDLQSSYPDVLGADAADFAIWLRECGHRAEGLPWTWADAFDEISGDRSLNRLLSFLSRNWELGRWAPLALCGVDSDRLTRVLMGSLHQEPEYQLDDLVAFQWLMDVAPHRGLRHAMELLRLFPEDERTATTQEDEDARLAPALQTEAARHELALVRHEQASRGRLPAVTAPARGHRGLVHCREVRSTGHESFAPGVNCIGYSRSPIGLGVMSRGLLQVLGRAAVPHAEVVLTTHSMERDLSTDSLIGAFEPTYGTNLWVGYPHMEEHLLRFQPRERVARRRNIAYLAWELAEGNPSWAEVYAEYDDVWALSDFAARSLTRTLGRRVTSLPCCIDVDRLPLPVSRSQLGLPEDRRLVLAVLDASSSVERKNPEAVIDAFRRAVRRDDRVTLVLRIANGWRRVHRSQIQRLRRRAADTGLDVRFIVAPLRADQVHQLISACDCYVSLHRAEGFGLTCAEAMAYERPVVATGASGNLEFMDHENSFLVPAAEAEVTSSQGPFRRGMSWFEPDLEAAAVQIRGVLDDPQLARTVGRLGRQSILEKLSPTRLAPRLTQMLHGPSGAGASTVVADTAI